MTEPARTSPPVGVIIGILVLLVVAALAVVLLRPPAPEPAPPGPPPTTAGAVITTGEAPSAAEPAAEAGARAPAPGSAQRPVSPPTAKGAGATGPAKAAGVAGGPPLPSDRRGTAGAPPALSAQAMMRRSFVPERSSVENRKGVGDDVSGFDVAGSKGVEVKRAPEITGRIEFGMDPLRVKPGDKYNLRISLVNEGKKTIEIEEILLRTIVNGKETRRQVTPRITEVASHQNEVVYELAGAWERTTSSWSLEAVVTSRRQDVYKNRVTWK